MSDNQGYGPGAGSAGQYADPARRYRLESRIATGGMGVVWRATDTRLNRPVAVKILKHEYADDATFRTRFETEARHAGQLSHAGIAGVYDYSADPGLDAPYLVMELVEGEPLSVLLRRAKDSGRSLDPDIVRDLMAQAADALAVAHRAGIVHRDVKPANLIVTPDRRIKVTDFGIARAADAAAITRTGAVMGTPQYISPEQARGESAVPASDVYSLGVVAFECLAGWRPFEADSPVATALAHLQQPVPDLPASVPAPLAAVVRLSLAKQPAQRYPDAAAFAAALRDPSRAAGAPPDNTATTVLPGVAAPVAAAAAAGGMERLTPAAAYEGESGEAPPGHRDEPKRPVWGVVLLVLALVIAVGVIAWLLLGGDDDEPDPVSETTSQETERTKSKAPKTTEPTEETSATEETSDAESTVNIDPDNYLGRPFDSVASDLEALGVEVDEEEVENDGSHEESVVFDISPTGDVPLDSTVTVSYWGEAPEEPETTATSESTPETPPTSQTAAEGTQTTASAEEGQSR